MSVAVASKIDDHPVPKAPTRVFDELYVRVTARACLPYGR